ncbi:unnamed protein product [Ixodes persulcatus]
MTDVQILLKEARDQGLRGAQAELIEGNLSKAVALYTIAGGSYLEALRSVRLKCTECMTRLRELKNYACSSSSSRGTQKTVIKQEDSDSGSDDEDEEQDNGSGIDREIVCHLEGVLVLGRSSYRPCSDKGIVGLVPKVLRLAGLGAKRHRSLSPERKPLRKILLYGPSATGKTCLPSTLVSRSINATVYYVSTPVLLNRCRLRGDVVLVQALFEDALRHCPSVLCFDDLDALCSSPKSPRDQDRLRALKSTWLNRVSHLVVKNDVLILGVTNNPWLLDDDIRSQFERILFVPLPLEGDRLRLLKRMVRSPALAEEDYKLLAKRTEGFTSTFLAMLAVDALRNARQVCEHVCDRALDPDFGSVKVTLSDVLNAMDKVELPDSMSRRSSITSKTESTITRSVS